MAGRRFCPFDVIDHVVGFSYHTETMNLDTENSRLHTRLYISENSAGIYPNVTLEYELRRTGIDGKPVCPSVLIFAVTLAVRVTTVL